MCIQIKKKKKEGFARLLEYVFIENQFPEWEYWKHFQMEICGSVLEKDEDFDATHPIEMAIHVPSEIFGNVDLIWYAKVWKRRRKEKKKGSKIVARVLVCCASCGLFLAAKHSSLLCKSICDVIRTSASPRLSCGRRFAKRATTSSTWSK